MSVNATAIATASANLGTADLLILFGRAIGLAEKYDIRNDLADALVELETAIRGGATHITNSEGEFHYSIAVILATAETLLGHLVRIVSHPEGHLTYA